MKFLIPKLVGFLQPIEPKCNYYRIKVLKNTQIQFLAALYCLQNGTYIF